MQPKNIFKDFKDINVSTKTYTASTNITLNLEKLFQNINVIDYKVVPKKRGRKRKDEKNTETNKQSVGYGSIITAKWEGNIKGCDLKSGPRKTSKTFFRNSVTIVIFFEKFINFKVCKSGKFQMTGCLNWNHAESCIRSLWNIIKNIPEIYEFSDETDTLKAMIVPSMRNIDFSVGFKVDREKLNNYISKLPDFHCLLESSFGYTGVSIKIPLDIEKRLEMEIMSYEYSKDDEVKSERKTYKYYLDTLPEKEKLKKLNEQKYNTFLVFQSGKVIFSGLTSVLMKDYYYIFTNMMKTGFDEIEERLQKS